MSSHISTSLWNAKKWWCIVNGQKKEIGKIIGLCWKGALKSSDYGLLSFADYQTISRENWVVWARDSTYLSACNTIMAYFCYIINMAINFKWCRISASLVTRGSTNFFHCLQWNEKRKNSNLLVLVLAMKQINCTFPKIRGCTCTKCG